MKILRTEREYDQAGNIVAVITFVIGEKSERVMAVRSA